MPASVAFDPVAKLITVTAPPVSGAVTVDVRRDLYSCAKEEWVADPALNRFRFPFRVIGGDTIGTGLFAGSYFFLRTDLGWRVRPFEADHSLTLVGNLYPEVATDPVFVPTVGAFTVPVYLERSSLTQSIVTGGVGSVTADVITALDSQGYTAARSALLEQLDPSDPSSIAASVELIRKITDGRLEVDYAAQALVLYDDDGTTPLRRWSLTTDGGEPVTTGEGVQARRGAPVAL